MSKLFPSGLRRSARLSIALAAALVLLFAFSVSAFAATLVVNDDGIPCGFGAATHSTIQSAVTAASSGDTIQVCNGVYTEWVDFGTKNMTLQGESQAGTIIGTTRSGIFGQPITGAFGISGEGTAYTISNITVVGPHLTTSTSGRGIKLFGAGVVGSSVTMQSVSVLNSEKTNIDLNGYASVSLTNVTARDAKAGAGIGMTDIGTATLNGITTSKNAWGGVALYTKRADSAMFSTGLTFAGTNSLGEVNALQVEFVKNGANFWSAKGINLANSGLSHVVAAFNPATTNTNVWSFTKNLTDANLVREVAIARYGNAVGPLAVAGEIDIIGNNSVDTISAAIAAAAPGDTILVGSGGRGG